MKKLVALAIASGALALSSSTFLRAAQEDVSWTNLVSATASGSTLTKSSDSATGGAVSEQSIDSGNGYLEFTVSEYGSNRGAGLSHGDSGPDLEDIDFAIRLNGAGSAEVWEAGTYQTETTYAGGERMRVEVDGADVVYKKDGTEFHRTPNAAISYPLLADAFMATPDSTIVGAVISAQSGGAEIVFESNWTTALGTSMTAITDGGLWDDTYCQSEILTVVDGGPAGYARSLQVDQAGESCRNVQKNNFVPPGQDYYLRFYMKNEEADILAGDHVATVDTLNYHNLTFVRRLDLASGWRFAIGNHACSDVPPNRHWTLAGQLDDSAWYRLEYFVHFVDDTHIQVTPRVYDASNTLLYTDADFVNEDASQTLASYQGAGGTLCIVNPAGGSWVNDFGLGNNGQLGAGNTGRWFFAGVQIRTDTWPGQ